MSDELSSIWNSRSRHELHVLFALSYLSYLSYLKKTNGKQHKRIYNSEPIKFSKQIKMKNDRQGSLSVMRAYDSSVWLRWYYLTGTIWLEKISLDTKGNRISKYCLFGSHLASLPCFLDFIPIFLYSAYRRAYTKWFANNGVFVFLTWTCLELVYDIFFF